MAETVTANGARLDKARFLVELYNRARPVGLGAFVPQAHEPLSLEEARQILHEQDGRFEFDYVRGRSLKVREEKGDCSHSRRLFDRDAYPGAFDEAVRAANPLQGII